MAISQELTPPFTGSLPEIELANEEDRIIILLSPEEVLAERIKRFVEDNPIVDPDAGFTATERWRMSGDTFPARLFNTSLRLVERRWTLDSDTVPCAEYYELQPRTLRNRAHKIASALNPDLLYLRFGQLTSDLESGIVQVIKDLRKVESD